jgi:4-diphosphocytidyl-2-C-methyl-D-erythritol kinase
MMNATALETAMAAPSITSTAPAKLNLTLDVKGKRPDGFHELHSLVTGVDLADRITCRLLDQPGVEVSCSDESLVSADNLGVRAAQALAKFLGIDPAISIHIEKRIPIAAGLGGGSSDAAVVLRICNEFWHAGLSDNQLASIGAEIGSDVPLFFSLPHAVIAGRGERVDRVAMRWSGWALLAQVNIPVSTAAVFRAWRTSDAPHRPTGRIELILAASHAKEITPHVSNDLTQAVFRVCPKICEVNNALEAANLGSFNLSGAGSTFFQLFDDQNTAVEIGNRMMNHVAGLRAAVAAVPQTTDPLINEE